VFAGFSVAIDGFAEPFQVGCAAIFDADRNALGKVVGMQLPNGVADTGKFFHRRLDEQEAFRA